MMNSVIEPIPGYTLEDDLIDSFWSPIANKWLAYKDGHSEEGIIGSGDTQQEAIDNYNEQIGETG